MTTQSSNIPARNPRNTSTRALVPITENNADFATLFGYRQDSESLNGYQHSCCIRALARYMIDNGIRKLPQWFGEHELPDYIFKSEETDEP